MAGGKFSGSHEILRTAWSYYVALGVLYDRVGIRGQVVKSARGAHHLALGVRLADPTQRRPALYLSESLAMAARVRQVIVASDEMDPGLVKYQFELPETMWQKYTRADVTGLGVGLAEQRQQVDISWEPPHRPHWLVTGEPGAGKSETMKTMAVAMASRFSPLDLQMIFIDRHGDFEALDGLDHILVMARSEETIRAALLYAGNEFVRRREHLIKDGPRLVVFIDEAEDIMRDDNALLVAQRIASEARKFNVNLVIGIQNPKQANLPGLLEKLKQRYIGAVDSAQTSARLSLIPGLQLHRLSLQGDFMQMCGANRWTHFQVAMATAAECARLPRGNGGVPADDTRRLNLARALPEAIANGDDDSDDMIDAQATQAGRLSSLFGTIRGESGKAGAGRPVATIRNRALAFYLWKGAETVSTRIAREVLGLGHDLHYRHRDAALEIEDEIQRLRAGNPPARLELEAE